MMLRVKGEEIHTPTDWRTSSGSFLAYISPRGERFASPPILPSRLNSDSPCYSGQLIFL
jgi:hypothetical protein